MFRRLSGLDLASLEESSRVDVDENGSRLTKVTGQRMYGTNDEQRVIVDAQETKSGTSQHTILSK